MTSMRRYLAANTAIGLVVACASGFSPAARAQTAPPGARPKGIEEVVVTARRRAERLQKVPVAVTAFSPAQIAQNKIVTGKDLGAVTPSLSIQQASYSPFSLLVGIRGQKTGDTILSQTPSIGIYVDDVYQPSTIGLGVGNLDDTQQIEVLKGPQGTLYGRNTTGGAIKITSRQPDYSGYYGSVKVGFGNYGSNEDAAMINLPIIPNELAVRGDFQREYHDGYAYNHTLNRPVDDLDSEAGRVAIKFDPLDSLDIVVRANLSDGHSGGTITNLESVKPVFSPTGVPTFSPALLNTGLQIGSISFNDLGPIIAPQFFGPPTPQNFANVIAGQEAAYAALTPYIRQGYNVNQDFASGGEYKDKGGSLNATYHINSDLAVKSVTSYQYAFQGAFDEVDGSPFDILQGPGDITSLDQFTQELQVIGTGLDNKLNYTAGVYYYYLTGSDDSPGEQELPFLNSTGSPVNTRDRLTDKSESFYSQATYAFIPTVHLTAGVRWTQEKTGLEASSTAGPTNACNLPPPAGIDGVACHASFNNKFHNFSYTAGLDWNATQDVLLYVKTSRGFKAGGQNQRGSITGGFDAFAPEEVTDYEIGAKSDFLQHRVRLNVAAYHSDYTNIQRTVLTVTPTQQTITEVQNAASATIDGVEAELTARPIPPLTLVANAAYTEPKYQSYFSGGVNLSNNLFEDQPLWQFNVGGTYVADLRLVHQAATLSSTLNFAYQSKVNFAPDNTSIYDVGYPRQGGYGVLNGRVGLDVPRYGVTVEVYGKNILDRKYLAGTTDVTDALGVGVGYLSDPRTYGFDVTQRF